MKRISAASASIVGLLVATGYALQQGPPSVDEEHRDAFDKILEFLYTVSHWIGELIVRVVHSIVPDVTIPTSLVDTIGILALLTVFLVVSDIAKRLAWIVVAVGWVLIVVRVVLIVTQSTGMTG